MTLNNGYDLLALLSVAVGSGIGVSFVTQLVKKIPLFQNRAVIHMIVVTLAVVAGGLQYFAQIHSQLPADILGLSIPAIYGVSQLLYKFVKYAYGEAEAVEQQLAPAQITISDTTTAALSDQVPAASTPAAPQPETATPALSEFQL